MSKRDETLGFTPDKDDLARVLCWLREKVCAYRGKPGHACDCKFGATEQSVGRMSEKGSGCPELLDAADLLAAMTPAEEKRIRARIARARRSAAKSLKEILGKKRAATKS